MHHDIQAIEIPANVINHFHTGSETTFEVTTKSLSTIGKCVAADDTLPWSYDKESGVARVLYVNRHGSNSTIKIKKR